MCARACACLCMCECSPKETCLVMMIGTALPARKRGGIHVRNLSVISGLDKSLDLRAQKVYGATARREKMLVWP